MRWLVFSYVSLLGLACTSGRDPGTVDARNECVDYGSIIEWSQDVCLAGSQACGQVAGQTCLCQTSWGSVCTTCPLAGEDIDPAPAVSGTCTISDWEHDWSCRHGLASGSWACCTDVFPQVCQGDACGDVAGAACCPQQVDESGVLVCVDGFWQ